MNEDEAKTKWCPMVRYDNNGDNRPPSKNGGPHCYCIGSACMMWREFGEHEWHGNIRGEYKVTTGFCGLAGDTGLPWRTP